MTDPVPHPEPDGAAASHAWGWTPARRAKQALAIQRWKPWLQSHGPITQQGKARVARNAYKPASVRRQITRIMAELKKVMRELKAAKTTPRRH